jgi:hypothetical protein
MAMGHWQTEQQQEFWIATDELSPAGVLSAGE